MPALPGSSTEALRYRQVAAALMRMALVLLDRSDDRTLAAARLQHALDTLMPPTTTLDDALERQWPPGGGSSYP